jgi:phosphoribosylglycinamide formyltransferase 1
MAIRLGWFSTGRDQAAIDLFRVVNSAIADGSLDAAISFCFCSRADGEAAESDAFLAQVRQANVPAITLSADRFHPEARAAGRTDAAVMTEWRLEYDREVMDLLGDPPVDVIVLAGYMLIVGPEMCARYAMLNLHPALPGGPTGTWQQVIRQVMETGGARTGAMIHLVTPELDRGPAITYFSIPARGGFDDIRLAGAARELPLILLTLREFAAGRLAVRDGRVYAGKQELTGGLDLTSQVEEWLTKYGSGDNGK